MLKLGLLLVMTILVLWSTSTYGLRAQNERGECLIQFCIENHSSIVSSMLQQHKSGLYTWHSPGGKFRNQIDYFLVGQQKPCHLLIEVATTQLLICEYAVKFKSCKKMKIKPAPKLDTGYRKELNEGIQNKINPQLQILAEKFLEKPYCYISISD